MADNYMSYNRNRFEQELERITGELNLQFGEYVDQGKRKSEERVYEVTTKNPMVRLLIYSSIDPRTNTSREVGGDAVRVTFYCMHKGKLYYKRHKTHQRISTLFNNLEKSIGAANDLTTTPEIENWLFKVRTN